MSKAIILIGGDTTGTRFRPLSLTTPKVLFPVAGKPLLSHLLDRLSRVALINEVVLMGFYDADAINAYIKEVEGEYRFKAITYLQEPPERPLGTAGGLYHYREQLLAGGARHFYLLYADVISAFHLPELANYAAKKKADLVVLGVVELKNAYQHKNDLDDNFGSIVLAIDGRVVHYVEKPELQVLQIINGGIYYFLRNFLTHHLAAAKERHDRHVDELAYLLEGSTKQLLSLERDILKLLPDTPDLRFYVLKYTGFWRQVKNASSALPANRLYLADSGLNGPALELPNVEGPVYLDETAEVDPSAKIGPNVAIGPGVKIGPGVRVLNLIIQKDVRIGANLFVKDTIISDNVRVGEWCRLEGTSDGEIRVVQDAAGNEEPVPSMVTILSHDTAVGDEVFVNGSVVLPHKELKNDVTGEVIM